MLHHESQLSAILFYMKNYVSRGIMYIYPSYLLVIKLYAVADCKFCVMSVTSYWMQTFSLIHNIIKDTLILWEILGEVFETDTQRWPLLSLITDNANCIFILNTTREICIRLTLVAYGCCQPISSKSKCQIRVSPLCCLDNPYFTGSIYSSHMKPLVI